MNGYIRNARSPKVLNVTYEMKRGFKASIPVVLSFIPFALLFGTQATQKGLSHLEIPLMTGLNFGGGSEFAAISVWTSTPQFWLIVGISVLVNIRHILMGAAFAPYMQHVSKYKALALLFFMCDESWAMALADAKKRQAISISITYYISLALCLYSTWIICTTLGSFIGNWFGNIERFGFDMAFTAVFLVLIKGMWSGVKKNYCWAVSLLVACLVAHYSSGAWYVLAGTSAGLITAWIGAKHNA